MYYLKIAIILISFAVLLSACSSPDDKAAKDDNGVSDTSVSEAEDSNIPVLNNADSTEEQAVSLTTTQAETISTAPYRKITADEAYQMMQNMTVTIVDARTPSEYAKGHIVNAISLPNDAIGDEAPAALPDKDAIVLIYCQTGKRSLDACEKLLNLGYQNIYDFGAISDWEYETTAEDE